MRTTLDLDPVVLSAARRIAAQRGISLGRAVSELALKALCRSTGLAHTASGLPIFYASPDAPAITLEDVNKHLNTGG